MSPERKQQVKDYAPWISIGIIIALTTGGWVWAAATASGKIQNHGERITKIETKVEPLSTKVEVIANDVQWIRRNMEAAGK